MGIRGGVTRLRSSMRIWRQFLCREEAATAVEYAVLLALILLAVIAGVKTLGNGTGNMWGGIETQTANAGLGK